MLFTFHPRQQACHPLKQDGKGRKQAGDHRKQETPDRKNHLRIGGEIERAKLLTNGPFDLDVLIRVALVMIFL